MALKLIKAMMASNPGCRREIDRPFMVRSGLDCWFVCGIVISCPCPCPCPDAGWQPGGEVCCGAVQAKWTRMLVSMHDLETRSRALRRGSCVFRSFHSRCAHARAWRGSFRRRAAARFRRCAQHRIGRFGPGPECRAGPPLRGWPVRCSYHARNLTSRDSQHDLARQARPCRIPCVFGAGGPRFRERSRFPITGCLWCAACGALDSCPWPARGPLHGGAAGAGPACRRTHQRVGAAGPPAS